MPQIELLHTDCMEFMAGLPDKAFDLAIVDPPYGMKELGAQSGGSNAMKHRAYHNGIIDKWDTPPPPAYFDELRARGVKPLRDWDLQNR